MNTATHTFNKDNWTGETATIVVKNGKFEFHGYDFEVGEEQIDRSLGDPKYDFHTIEFKWEGKPWMTARRFACDKVWECGDEEFSRSHAEPAVLCAIMAANLI